ncbi:class I SAM-dependent methyltransferase [Paenibacillus riograndensis]|uniref:Methyltransferase type 11 n=1 Tax=Paenibacillus riograndensis SBR5 TaxID=1073571 RepID=A0A0E4CXS3_9BACL|nr:class I SAM-dependent methyltransferase [Paenibacillus riograndensis]CQR56711.1 methyltransferase type 11 [Paenibacillus riograndensis SBR5]
MKGIINYYDRYNEAARLTTDHARRLEFITTTHFLDTYLKGDSQILDLGAGAGIYTFYYAQKGHTVISTDLTPKHVEIISQRASDEGYANITAAMADATDLSRYPDESFDAVLCLGPLYHLTDIPDQDTCIRECLRVLRPGGLLAAAYVNRLFIYPHLVKSDPGFLDTRWIQTILEEKQISSTEADCFWTDAFFHTPGEIEALIEAYGTQKLVHAASDGISILLRETLNGLTTEQFNIWVDYHLRTCTEPSILGMSNHGLYLCRKT